MEKNNSWVLLIIVALASFIIALNCSFMNVAISQLVIDLNTTVYAVQAIISFYTLITASLILVGAKLQDIFGKKKIFVFFCFLNCHFEKRLLFSYGSDLFKEVYSFKM